MEGPVDVDSCRIVWKREGSGSPLLLVHGWPLHSSTWDGVLPHLTRTHTCFAPDLPGLGETEWSDGADLSFAAQARRLAKLVDALGLDRYSMIAQDTGATIARLVAAQHGERVRALVLLNTEIPGHRPPWIPLFQKTAALPGSTLGFSLSMRSRAFLRSPMGFGGCFHDRARIDDAFVSRYVEPLLRERRRMEGALRYLRGIDWSIVDGLPDVHRRITARVRLVWGTEDPTFPLERARPMVAHFRNADLVEVPRARLLLHEERPEAVAAATSEVLAAAA
jgi:haloalkane dehalogenase